MIQVPLLLLGTLLLGQSADVRPTISARPDAVVLKNCLITLSEEAQVPANEPGALIHLSVKDGDTVTKDQLLAQIDDARSQIECEAARFKWQVSKLKSENDISVRYSLATADVAETEVKKNLEANQKVAGAVPEINILEAKLKVTEAKLKAEQDRFTMKTDGIEAQGHKAEMDGAQENINRRKIRSPLDGIVVDLRRHEGEWIQAGDPLLRVVRVDRLRVETYVPAADYSAADLSGRLVTVNVTLPHGREEAFYGKVVFINPQVETSGEFRVRVEVLNRKENNFWLLRPGLLAEMTIHLK